MRSAIMGAGETALLIIDVQEKLIRLLPERERIVGNIAFLLEAARILDVPVSATEQYPRGLGPTVPELAPQLPKPLEKVTFSCGALATLRLELSRPKLLLAGIETHVCVLQSALDLLAANFQVYVAADAVGSRFTQDHQIALRRLERAGAILTSSESAVFELTGSADRPNFKEISRLVRERMEVLASAVAVPHG